MPEVVCDTSPLQYLFQCDLLDLLPRLYRSVLIPEAVAKEIEVGRIRGVPLPDPGRLEWIEVQKAPHRDFLRIVADLGPGEREVLALAGELREPLALLDDALGRRHARLLGIPFTGTLGVLLRAKDLGYIPEVKPTIARLERLGFRLDRNTRTAVLTLAGEGVP